MGEWKEKNAAWYDQSMTYCVCCGLVIPKTYWEAEIMGEVRVFCTPDCERLYLDYWLPAQKEPEPSSG